MDLYYCMSSSTKPPFIMRNKLLPTTVAFVSAPLFSNSSAPFAFVQARPCHKQALVVCSFKPPQRLVAVQVEVGQWTLKYRSCCLSLPHAMPMQNKTEGRSKCRLQCPLLRILLMHTQYEASFLISSSVFVARHPVLEGLPSTPFASPPSPSAFLSRLTTERS